MIIIKLFITLRDNDLVVPGEVVVALLKYIQIVYVHYIQYNVIKCNSAMRVAGLSVCIVWRYIKPRGPAA